MYCEFVFFLEYDYVFLYLRLMPNWFPFKSINIQVVAELVSIHVVRTYIFLMKSKYFFVVFHLLFRFHILNTESSNCMYCLLINLLFIYIQVACISVDGNLQMIQYLKPIRYSQFQFGSLVKLKIVNYKNYKLSFTQIIFRHDTINVFLQAVQNLKYIFMVKHNLTLIFPISTIVQN